MEKLARDLLETIEDNEQRLRTARQIAITIGRENPRFDRERFLNACGIDPSRF